MSVGAAALAGLAALTVSPNAQADDDFQLAGQVGVGWMRQTPSLETPELSTPARELGKLPVPTKGGLTMMNASLDLAMVWDTRWTFRLAGFGGGWALGSYDRTITSVDGSIADLRPWTAYRFDGILPGLHYRFKRRRWMFGVGVGTGFSVLVMSGSIASGTTSVPFEAKAPSFVVQADVEGCRRLDPTTRLCLTVSPRVYDFGILNGAVAGLRMEFGK